MKVQNFNCNKLVSSKTTKVVLDLPDSEYHKQSEKAEDHYFSSTQLKDIKSEKGFVGKYITKTIPPLSIPAFDVGTYFHTAVLEPEKLDGQITTFTGKVKRGKLWEAFEEANKDKIILSASQLEEGERLVENTMASKPCVDYMNGMETEVSFYAEIEGFKVKVRTDIIHLNKASIGDLKSTKNFSGMDDIRKKVEALGYDLSASLYLDVVNKCIEASNKITGDNVPLIETFVWIFASKDKFNPDAVKVTASKEMIEIGRAKYKKALQKIKELRARNWEAKEEEFILEVSPWDKARWLNISNEELKQLPPEPIDWSDLEL